MMPQIPSYNFPNADWLEEEFRLLKLEENTGYTTKKPHRHNYFELFYFTGSGGHHLIDFQEYPIREVSLHMVCPGALHLVKRDPGSSGYVLLFTKNFLYTLSDFTPAAHQRLWREKPFYHLSAQENQFVSMSFAQMLDELKGERPYRQRVMASLLQMIFILMYRQAPPRETNTSTLAERFFDLVDAGFTTDSSALDMAAQLGCSLKTLNRALKEAGHHSARACMVERKLLEARRLLIHSDWSIKEIAFHLNFSDPDYFGKVFKDGTGITPTAFREMHA